MAAGASWLGRSIERVEDAALLTGRGRYIDDLGVPPGTLHAAILRSSHAHANIRAIRTEAAAAAPGVAAVITGRDVVALSTPPVPVLRVPLEGWPIPVETYGIVADYDPGEDAYDVLANFMGPFSLHAVMARALKVPGNRLRLRTPPDAGGSFGVKQGLVPYMVLIGIAARVAGRPVKWIEDRLEARVGSVSATNRVTRLSAAVDDDGRIRALDWDQVEDVGAHLRAPEPATLYRMHGNLTGAYDIRNVAVRNRVVLTNKTPSGLNRGFGGPQDYYALERLMQRIAVELRRDPLDVIRRNLIAADAFPYRPPTGGL